MDKPVYLAGSFPKKHSLVYMDRIGYCVRCDFEKVDAALIRIDIPKIAFKKASLDIKKIGAWRGTAKIMIGDIVAKYGSRTGLTHGKVDEINISGTVDYTDVLKKKFTNLISIVPDGCDKFSSRGDSGSCVFNSNSEMIGLHFAGAKDDSYGLAFPIDMVESALDIQISPNDVDRGKFNTIDVRKWKPPKLETYNDITFTKAFSSPPGIALGLNSLDISKKHNVRIEAKATNITKSGFRVHLNGWADTKIHSAGCSWFLIAPEDTHVLYGTFLTTEDHAWNQPKESTKKQIVFSTPFKETPDVVVWLNKLDLNSKKDWRICARANNIKTDGFELEIKTWNDSVIWEAGATWIALPANSQYIQTGSYRNYKENGSGLNSPQHISFDIPSSDYPIPVSSIWGGNPIPKVVTGISQFHVKNNKNLRINNYVTDIDYFGMTCHIETWDKTRLYNTDASYIAFADSSIKETNKRRSSTDNPDIDLSIPLPPKSLQYNLNGNNLVLSWAKNGEANIMGYQVHYGKSSGDYVNEINVGNTTSYNLEKLETNKTYYFVVTATNNMGNESNYSDELVVILKNAE